MAKLIKGKNDLLTLFPKVAEEWNYEKNIGIIPSEIIAHSNKKFWWKCIQSHSWEASPNNRVKGRGCPYCSNKKVLEGYNDLATMNPKITKEWNFKKNIDLEPTQITSSSERKVWWICEKGHEWKARIVDRNRGNGCPFCSGRLAITGENDLVTVFPQLANEWNYNKNNNLLPSNVKSKSGQSVWWICNKGHEWKAKISDRANGNGCPYCANLKILSGYNDLATTDPELALEWNSEKNGNITPNNVVRGSNKKVWWKCKKNHEWEASISHRAQGVGCPICSNKKVLTGYNDLKTTNPKLSLEWHPTKNKPLTPQLVTEGSSKKIWWICNKGHEWQSTITNRNKGRGCPICSQEQHTSFPEKAVFYYIKNVFIDAIENYRPDNFNNMELDIYIPSKNIAIEYDGEWWHESIEKDLKKNDMCKNIGIHLFRIREPNCPLFSDDSVILKSVSYNDLSEGIRKLFDLLEVFCDVDVIRDESQIRELIDYGEKDTSLLNMYPTISNEWHPTKNGKLLPLHVKPYSNKNVWWLGVCGHEWKSTVNNRTRGGNGCPYCSGRKVLKGFNDLQTLRPNLCLEWNYLKNKEIRPDSVTVSSGKKVWWECENGHEWKATIASRSRGCGCPRCKKNNNY